jgi:hypothetical protein
MSTYTIATTRRGVWAQIHAVMYCQTHCIERASWLCRESRPTPRLPRYDTDIPRNKCKHLRKLDENYAKIATKQVTKPPFPQYLNSSTQKTNPLLSQLPSSAKERHTSRSDFSFTSFKNNNRLEFFSEHKPWHNSSGDGFSEQPSL